MIKRVINIKKLHDQKDDYTYWLSIDPVLRIGEVENIRSEYHGEYYASEQRFQRIYRVIKHK